MPKIGPEIAQGENTGVADNLPVVTYSRWLGESIKYLGIDYDRFAGGLEHLGVDPITASDTAIHFTDVGHDRFAGVHFGGSKVFNRLVRVPFINGKVLDDGFQKHQFAYDHMVVINLHGADSKRRYRDGLLGDRLNVTSKKKIRSLEVSDCVALVLAHEMGHTLPEHEFRMRGSKKSRRVEGDIDHYMAECIDLGAANPWRGVIQLKTV